MGSQITWLGHSAFRIDSYDGTRILVDPWIEGNPQCPVGIDALADVHAICVTHDHPHHVGQAVEIAKRSGAAILAASPLTSRLMREESLERELVIHNGAGLNIGGTCRLASVKATLVEAVHASRHGASTGFVFTLENGKRVYHAGDTSLFYGMKLLAKLFSPSLACLPVGGVFTMDAKQATLAVQLMKLRRLWPMHYGALPELAPNLDELRMNMSKHCPDTEIVFHRPGDAYELE